MNTAEYPLRIRMIIGHYFELCKQNGRSFCSFAIEGIPMTVNSQYIHTRFNTRLKEEVKKFRLIVKAAMNSCGQNWSPKGVAAIVLVVESPHWITQKHTVAKMDVDNRLKPLIDAIKLGKGASVDDCIYWDVIIFKQTAKKKRTLVYLFDLGDVVEYLS